MDLFRIFTNFGSPVSKLKRRVLYRCRFRWPPLGLLHLNKVHKLRLSFALCAKSNKICSSLRQEVWLYLYLSILAIFNSKIFRLQKIKTNILNSERNASIKLSEFILSKQKKKMSATHFRLKYQNSKQNRTRNRQAFNSGKAQQSYKC